MKRYTLKQGFLIEILVFKDCLCLFSRREKDIDVVCKGRIH